MSTLAEQVQQLEERLQAKGREVTQLRSDLIAAEAQRRAAERAVDVWKLREAASRQREATARAEGAREGFVAGAFWADRELPPDTLNTPLAEREAARRYPRASEGEAPKRCALLCDIPCDQCRPTPSAPERVPSVRLSDGTLLKYAPRNGRGYIQVDHPSGSNTAWFTPEEFAVVRRTYTPDDTVLAHKFAEAVSLAAQDGGRNG